MTVLIVFVVLFLALFVGAFLSKRRFGLLGLALTAGATLSGIWTYYAGLIISSTGLMPSGPLTDAIALSLIVLLPAIILLFHGYTYKENAARVIGSLLFAVLALAFLVEPIGHALFLEGTGADVYRWLSENRDVIISIGVVAAVVDLFFTKPAKLAEKDKKR
jgi:hypothetical protein